MRNARFTEVLTDLGLDVVGTVAGTGNVVFDSASRALRSLEQRIEDAWPERLGFRSITILRTRAQIMDLLEADPFAGLDDAASRFQVTFLRRPPARGQVLPEPVADSGWQIVSADDRHVCWTIDTTRSTTPDGMRALERAFGEAITTRTWRTVAGIAKKLD
ncbi:DUF1697 domain-containing protein [Actinomarinicola tropica]|uniref:DUF1697 domain-containing protein n=2 Tax=Actinomarinicola tropica TaxID=2789776 RepID=A0A5Q2RQ70_9ACTN|nr:DUF1697 domain-containing protein [Actinomarinicola tropica]